MRTHHSAGVGLAHGVGIAEGEAGVLCSGGLTKGLKEAGGRSLLLLLLLLCLLLLLLRLLLLLLWGLLAEQAPSGRPKPTGTCTGNIRTV